MYFILLEEKGIPENFSIVSDLLAKKLNYEPRRKSSELEGRSSSLCFGGWGDENTGGSVRGRGVWKPLMPVPALSPQALADAAMTTRQGRAHQQLAGLQGRQFPRTLCEAGTF